MISHSHPSQSYLLDDNDSTIKAIESSRVAAIVKLLGPFEKRDHSPNRFASQRIPLNTELATKLGKALAENTTITILWPEVEFLDDQAVFSFAEGLKKNRTLKVLILDNCNISSLGVRYLADALKENKTLEKLSLNTNKIDNEGAAYLAFSLLERPSLAVSLDYNNEIDETHKKRFTPWEESSHARYIMEFGGVTEQEFAFSSRAQSTAPVFSSAELTETLSDNARLPQSYVYQYRAKEKKIQRDTIKDIAISSLTVKEVKGRWIDIANLDYDAYGYDDKKLDPELIGKWVLKYPAGSSSVDEAYAKLICGIQEGKLWQAKISPKSADYPQQMICVYTPNYKNNLEINETYDYLLSLGFKKENITGYKRDSETKSGFDMYSHTASGKENYLFKYFPEIKKLCLKWLDNELTEKKKMIFNHFSEYCSKQQDAEGHKLEIIKQWVLDYSQTYKGQNPFEILKLHRRPGCFGRLFSFKDTDSIKIFKKMLDSPLEKEALDRMIKGDLSELTSSQNVPISNHP